MGERGGTVEAVSIRPVCFEREEIVLSSKLNFLRTAAVWNRTMTMARVKIEEIIEQLDSDLRKALRDAVRRVIPNVDFDERRLFREFVRAVGRKCSTWETVNDSFVEKN